MCAQAIGNKSTHNAQAEMVRNKQARARTHTHTSVRYSENKNENLHISLALDMHFSRLPVYRRSFRLSATRSPLLSS